MKISLNFPDNLLNKMDAFCEKHDYERSEFVRAIVRGVLEGGMDIQPMHPKDIHGTTPPKNKPSETGTMAPENISPVNEFTPAPNIIVKGINPEPEVMWEDYNLMPVYKTGEPEQYCVTWHSKGERRTVYPIKKFRADGTLELEGKYCKDCIKEFLAKDGHLE